MNEKLEQMKDTLKDNFTKEWNAIDESQADKPDRFYQATWFVVLALIFCFPVGLFLMWKYRKFKSGKIRIIITGALCLMAIISLFDDSGAGAVISPVASTVVNTTSDGSLDTKFISDVKKYVDKNPYCKWDAKMNIFDTEGEGIQPLTKENYDAALKKATDSIDRIVSMRQPLIDRGDAKIIRINVAYAETDGQLTIFYNF